MAAGFKMAAIFLVENDTNLNISNTTAPNDFIYYSYLPDDAMKIFLRKKFKMAAGFKMAAIFVVENDINLNISNTTGLISFIFHNILLYRQR